jgi:hypothetical protein
VQVGDSAEKMISGLESYKHAFEFHFHTRHVGGPHGTDRRLSKLLLPKKPPERIDGRFAPRHNVHGSSQAREKHDCQ